jgi:hypothetical protein
MLTVWKQLVFVVLFMLMATHFPERLRAATSPQEATQPVVREKAAKTRVAKSVLYINKRYGFSFTLPKSWKGYSIVVSEWGGSTLDKPTKSVAGLAISIRHPSWTLADPYQDIPIMVFTYAQWKLVEENNLNVSAAPFEPNEIARNTKYVFALPPRFDYSNWTGTEEVDQLLQNHPLHPF